MDVALKFGLSGHRESLGDIWAESKRGALAGSLGFHALQQLLLEPVVSTRTNLRFDLFHVEPARFQDLQGRLLEHFEGLTYFPQPNQGVWKFGNITYRCQIVIYRVISQDAATSREFLSHLKARLKQDLRQEEILMIEREIARLSLLEKGFDFFRGHR